MKFAFKLLLFLDFFFVLVSKLVQLDLVCLLQLLQLLILVLDRLLLLLDEFFLGRDLLTHVAPLLVLILLVLEHVRFQIGLHFAHLVNLSLLLGQHVLGVLQFVMLVAQLVDLSLQLVWLLLFDHLDVAIGDLLDLGEAAVRETVPLQSNVDQSGVLVQGFKHHSFDLLTEEIVSELDLADALVVLESVDQVDEAGVVQSARAEVESLQFSLHSAITSHDARKELHDGVSEEVFVADKSLKVGLRKDFAQHLESSWANFVQRYIQLLQVRCVLQTLSQQDHPLITDHVAFDIERLKGLVSLQTLRQSLRSVHHQFIVLQV